MNSQQLETDNLKLITCEVAHDLNNFLFLIAGQVEYVLNRMGDSQVSSDELLSIAKTNLESVLDVSRSSAELVSDLMIMSVPCEYAKIKLNLNSFIDDLTNKGVLRLLCDSRNIKVKVSHDHELSAPVSERYFTRAMMNIINNAIDAGATSVEIKTSIVEFNKPELRYELIEPGQYAVVEISDNGNGIDEKNMLHIFDASYSTKKLTERSGTGLGLPIVRKVIRQHKGFIDLMSEHAKGTTFRVYLPLN